MYRPDNREFLFQPPAPADGYRIPGYGALFKDFDNSGFDECLPTVAACRYPGRQFHADLPDHGEVWSVPWEWNASDNNVELRCRGKQLPFIFYKQLRLRQDSLLISYKIENTSSESLDYLWSSHPLLAVRPGDRVMVPPEVREVFINQSHSGRLGGFGGRTPWPLTVDRNGAATDLSLLHPPSAGTAEKFFTPRLRSRLVCSTFSFQQSFDHFSLRPGAGSIRRHVDKSGRLANGLPSQALHRGA